MPYSLRGGAEITMAASNLQTARNYFKAIENSGTGETLARFVDPAVVQEEFPNRLLPRGARRSLSEMLAEAERGQKLLSRQSYEIHNAIEQGDQAALEVTWTGVLKVPFQSLPARGTMRARLAVFLKFREGRIVEQRNYDCFDPW
jgi:ketosteroid isomerase-like protein